MTPQVALLTIALSSTTATTAVPRDLYLDYAACTRGRQVCAAQRQELRDRLADCEDAQAPIANESAPSDRDDGFGLLEVVGVSAIVAVVAGAVGLVVGAGVAK